MSKKSLRGKKVVFIFCIKKFLQAPAAWSYQVSAGLSWVLRVSADCMSISAHSKLHVQEVMSARKYAPPSMRITLSPFYLFVVGG